jgi:hypothetical protein
MQPLIVDFSAAVEAKLRGGSTELKFFEAFQVPDWRSPYWWRSLHRASWQEDGEGTDAFVEVDAGTVPVQIKSSVAGRLKHIARYGEGTHCIVVIDPCEMDLVKIRSNAVDRIYRFRGILKGAFTNERSAQIGKRRAQRGHRRW